MNKSALIILDIQNDFLPGGALPAFNSETIIPITNQIIHQFPFVAATKDWHPKDHVSFASQYSGKNPFDTIELKGKQQALFPDHCIQESFGAELAHDLDTSGIHHIFHKGAHRDTDSYSAFFEEGHAVATGLHTLLKFHKIKTLYLVGIATEYSVSQTALDALKLGYQVRVLVDACCGLNKNADDSTQTLSRLAEANVQLITVDQLNRVPTQLNFEFSE